MNWIETFTPLHPQSVAPLLITPRLLLYVLRTPGGPDTARCKWWKATCVSVTSTHKNVVMETQLGEIKMYYFQDVTLKASSVLNFRRLRIFVLLCLTLSSQLVTTLTSNFNICVFRKGAQNKQRLFPYATLTDLFLTFSRLMTHIYIYIYLYMS